MKTLRTPDDRFKGLKDFPFDQNYVEIPDGEGGRLRIHFVDENPGSELFIGYAQLGEIDYFQLFLGCLPNAEDGYVSRLVDSRLDCKKRRELDDGNLPETALKLGGGP